MHSRVSLESGSRDNRFLSEGGDTRLVVVSKVGHCR